MIRQSFVNWRKVTEQLLLFLDEKSEEKRDEMVAKVNQLLDVRDQLQKVMQAPFTDEEKELGKELMELESVLQKKLEAFTKKIRQEISVSQSKKSHVKSYVNPYQSVMQDGTYYDTKQ